jgi:hypothetical protein
MGYKKFIQNFGGENSWKAKKRQEHSIIIYENQYEVGKWMELAEVYVQ